MKKVVWIVNYYSTPPEFVSNPRHLEFSKNLMKAGYDVTIFCAASYRRHGFDLLFKNKEKYTEAIYENYSFVHIKVKGYSSNGLMRMFSIFQFAWRVFKYRKNFIQPDIILHNIHAPFDYPILWCAKNLKAKYIVEAWDLWPDSFIRFGLVSKYNPIVPLAFEIEKRLYQKADKVIFSFEGGKDYLLNKKWTIKDGGSIDLKKVYYINNGVNLEEFNYNVNEFRVEDPDLLNNDYFKVVYMGSIRLVNNIKTLVDAAKLLTPYADIKVLIYGDGDERDFLMKYCVENEINNVVFKDKWMQLKYVPFVLSQSSLNILNYQKEFGIYGISSGKFFLYLAAGKPICSNVKIKYCLIEKHNLGTAQNLDTPEKYAEAILNFVKMEKYLYNSMCNRVVEVSKQFDYIELSEKLIKVFDSE